MSDRKRLMMMSLALGAGVTLGTAVAAEEGATIFERLNSLDAVESEHSKNADEVQRQISQLDTDLESRWESVDVALRAAKPIRHDVNHSLAVWLGAHRAAEREAIDAPVAREDTHRLLKYASARALPATLRDVDVVQRADAERDAFGGLLNRRANLTIDLALSTAAVSTAHQSRGSVVEKARRHGASADLEATNDALNERLQTLPPQESKVDFHTYKGTLARPVAMDPASGFGATGTLIRPGGLTYRPAAGEDVYAVGPGRVAMVESVVGWGAVTVIDHGGGYRSVYGHLEEISVSVDDRVQRADVIAATGETGSLDGVRTYYELRKDGEPVDPSGWFLKR